MNLFKAGDRIIYFKMPEQNSNYVYIVQLDNETMIKNAEKRRHKITSGCEKTMRLRNEKKT